MDRFNPETLRVLRPEMEAALAAIAEKHGIKLQLGKMTYTPDGGSFTAKVEAKVEAIASAAEEKLFREAAALFGYDPDKVATTPQGEVRLVGYNPKKRSKPWMLTVAGKPGYAADDRYCGFYFKADAPTRPELVETAPPARSETV